MAETKKAEAPKTEVVDWQKQLNDMAIATAAAEKPSGNWVSFKSGVLSIGGNQIKGNKIDVVVVQSLFETNGTRSGMTRLIRRPPIASRWLNWTTISVPTRIRLSRSRKRVKPVRRTSGSRTLMAVKARRAKTCGVWQWWRQPISLRSKMRLLLLLSYPSCR